LFLSFPRHFNANPAISAFQKEVLEFRFRWLQKYLHPFPSRALTLFPSRPRHDGRPDFLGTAKWQIDCFTLVQKDVLIQPSRLPLIHQLPASALAILSFMSPRTSRTGIYFREHAGEDAGE
jgi:hypothetical protein